MAIGAQLGEPVLIATPIGVLDQQFGLGSVERAQGTEAVERGAVIADRE